MLYGLAGKARCGKNTAGDLIREVSIWDRPVTYALADPIKQIINSLFGWDDRHSDGYLKEIQVCFTMPSPQEVEATLRHKLDLTSFELVRMVELFCDVVCVQSYVDDDFNGCISPRKAYQLFGTEVGRATRDTIWLDQAQIILDRGESLVVTDIRFENEAKWVREQDGVVIHIERSESTSVEAHASEVGIERFVSDWCLTNNDTLDKLHSSVSDLVYNIRRDG